MKLGEKIKAARLNAGMTQAELAGDFITRNMLSQIENGLAMPSLQTALYIADKLGLDACILFSEGDNKDIFFLTRKLPELKRLYTEGSYDKCIELCSDGADSCDEALLLLAECYIKKAYDLFFKGKLRQALKNGENAVKTVSRTIYPSDSIKQRNEALEVVISALTPYLKQTKHKAEEKKYLSDRFAEWCDKRIAAKRLETHMLMESGRYADALDMGRELLKETSLGVPFEYVLYCDLEVCCRELKDFENAYKYSQMAKRIFEEMQQ